MIDRVAEQVADIIANASDEVIAVIARRLEDLGEPGAMRAYERRDLEEIERILRERTDEAVNELINGAGLIADANDQWASQYYNAAGVSYGGWESDPLFRGLINQAMPDINLSSTSAFILSGNVHTIASAYTTIVNQAATGVVMGQGLYKQHRRAIRELTRSGLRTVTYEPGSHAEKLASKGILSVKYPSGRTLRADTALSMNISDAFRQTMSQIREEQGRQFGADGVEVSAHALCAPDHVDIQGRQYTHEEFRKMNDSLARRIGTCNCRHITFPVILGVSQPPNEELLNKYKELSEQEVEWTGLGGGKMSATRYDATQYQRQLETSLRTKKSEARTFAAMGDDEAARRANTQARALQKSYREISAEMGLKYRPDRAR